LGESERLGYDILSDGRLIEVKSSSDFDPDIFMSSNEFKTLQKEQNKYFVYVVKDALRNPILCINSGKMLAEVVDIKTIIPFSKWKKLTEEEFQP